MVIQFRFQMQLFLCFVSYFSLLYSKLGLFRVIDQIDFRVLNFWTFTFNLERYGMFNISSLYYHMNDHKNKIIINFLDFFLKKIFFNFPLSERGNF